VAAFGLSFRRLYDRTLASARQDQMTGFLNKSAFGQEAAFLLSKGRASETTMLLAVLDLDGFKQLNDAPGHAAGDAVLKDFSVNLMGEIRRSDRIGCIGGDEFDLALAAAGRPVTFSMGALIVPPHVASAFEPLMEEADKLLYAAKRQGRNTVVVAAAGMDGAGRKHGAAAGQTPAGAAPAG
jgi:GGDEF domain-containing protein